ncbi:MULTISPECIES: NTP transferase domain-containing protein [Thiomicrorhabdus]|uniref:NTP transferase domain-containing protein n=1 Tax=Thiomicrorhabdus heinhorstiae TaxID=2748010 RepID=A0ABS0BY58_9GAMM|nr:MULTISPECIES: NTP transferase domain-containing protein [Thiomicrorhabdus]MBF6058714.1 NTP transferase domain-containing protein [Thiomicrorhabdus heinhorstiae]
MVGILILAGGQGRRMNGLDKGWVECQNKPLIQWLLDSLHRQLAALANGNFKLFVSANRNLQSYATLCERVIKDEYVGYQGPLAGIASVMRSEEAKSIQRWVVIPVDAFHLPDDFVNKMLSIQGDEVGYACQAVQEHYAFLSIPQTRIHNLNLYLSRGGRSIKGWLREEPFLHPVRFAEVDFFGNFNSLQELKSTRKGGFWEF